MGGPKLYLLLEELKREAAVEAKAANSGGVFLKRSAAESVYEAATELQRVVKKAYDI